VQTYVLAVVSAIVCLSLFVLPQSVYVITFAKVVMFLPVFVCLFVCLSVCLCVSKITQKVIDESFRNFEGMSDMAQATSDLILGVIRQKSWILDHFEIFLTIALKGA